MGFDDGDLIAIDLPTEIASLFLDENDAFGTDNNLDAVHVLQNGNVIFSTEGRGLQLDGQGQDSISLGTDELDLYVFVRDPGPGQDKFVLFQDASADLLGLDGTAGYNIPFESDSAINAISFLDDGRVIFSVEGDGTEIDDISVDKSDLVLYDSASGEAEIIFDLDAAFGAFGWDSDQNPGIDALHVVSTRDTSGGDYLLEEIIISVIGDLKDGDPEFQDHQLFEVTFDASGAITGTNLIFDTEAATGGSTMTPINAYSQTDVLDFRTLLDDETEYTFGDDINDFVAITSPNGTASVFLDPDGDNVDGGVDEPFALRGTVEGFGVGDVVPILVPGGPAGATEFVTVLPDGSV